MGVLTEYFRSPDATAAAAFEADRASVDRVVANGIDPAMALAQLIELIRGESGFAGSVDHADVGAGGGPWIYELDDRFRQTLADMDDLRVPEFAARWSLYEEFGDDTDIAGLAYVIEGLSGLARRAREEDERLYCWVSR